MHNGYKKKLRNNGKLKWSNRNLLIHLYTKPNPETNKTLSMWNHSTKNVSLEIICQKIKIKHRCRCFILSISKLVEVISYKFG